MVPKCKVFMNITEHFTDFPKKKCLPNKEYVHGHRCERTNMATRYKYLQVSVDTYICTYMQKKASRLVAQLTM